MVPVKAEVGQIVGALGGFLTTAALDAMVEASEHLHNRIYHLLHAAITGEKSTQTVGLPSTKAVRERAEALVSLLAENEATQPLVDYVKKLVVDTADKKAKQIIHGMVNKEKDVPHEEPKDTHSIEKH